jgi:hypothetical protein
MNKEKNNDPLTAPARNLRFSGYMKLCASFQVLRLQTAIVSEIANFL